MTKESQGSLVLAGDSVLEARELAAIPTQFHENRSLSHMVMTLPVEDQNRFLGEYKERRDNFREWLLSQMIEGVHFGFAPTTEPKWAEQDGVRGVNVWNSKTSKNIFIPEYQWKPKPMLYAAGADFLCDLLVMQSRFEMDMQAWEQLGKPVGCFVVKCTLVNDAGEILATGRGARKVGQKGGDENNAIKMAQKSAKVDAVISCKGLRDLFVQDGPPKDPNENPEKNLNAPKATPRAERQLAVTIEELKTLRETYIAKNAFHPDDGKIKFAKWAVAIHGSHFKALDAGAWTRDTYKNCQSALEEI
jgi:hypothetical protein